MKPLNTRLLENSDLVVEKVFADCFHASVLVTNQHYANTLDNPTQILVS